MQRGNKKPSLSKQVKDHADKPVPKKKTYDGDTGLIVTTGSTLLDLAISGGRVRGGGIPAGVLIEIFGPSASGKTVLLSEIAGAIQRIGGEVAFFDPEARLNKTFAQIFDLKITDMNYSTPDTIPEVFEAVRKWKGDPSKKIMHGMIADSLAALSTNLEMGNDDGDKMGMRRPKEFSEQLRKTARILSKSNMIMVCSNQIRENVGVTFGEKYKSPGGYAIGFYSSLRLRTELTKNISVEKTIKGKVVKRITGLKISVHVYKSSIWKPKRVAPVTIDYDYGIDDIRENLQFIKDYSTSGKYTLGDRELDKSMNKSIAIIEEEDLEGELKEEVIDLWELIESKFEVERKKKKR